MAQKTALVTGGNKGIGLETCRQLGKLGFHVILTSRDPAKGKPRAEELRKAGMAVTYYPLDIADAKSIENLYKKFMNDIGRIDVLINNAAILIDRDNSEPSYEILRETLNTNVIGAYHLCDLFTPFMKKQKEGRVVNVSSEAGKLHDIYDTYPAYSISKAALNAVTAVFAKKMEGVDVLVNSICPGWVKTDMGGAEAPRSLEEGARGVIWAATLPKGGPSGGFFSDGKALEW